MIKIGAQVMMDSPMNKKVEVKVSPRQSSQAATPVKDSGVLCDYDLVDQGPKVGGNKRSPGYSYSANSMQIPPISLEMPAAKPEKKVKSLAFNDPLTEQNEKIEKLQAEVDSLKAIIKDMQAKLTIFF